MLLVVAGMASQQAPAALHQLLYTSYFTSAALHQLLYTSCFTPASHGRFQLLPHHYTLRNGGGTVVACMTG